MVHAVYFGDEVNTSCFIIIEWRSGERDGCWTYLHRCEKTQCDYFLFLHKFFVNITIVLRTSRQVADIYAVMITVYLRTIIDPVKIVDCTVYCNRDVKRQVGSYISGLSALCPSGRRTVAV